jgi:hypothetical protein
MLPSAETARKSKRSLPSRSIETFGFNVPVLIDANFKVIAAGYGTRNGQRG